MERYIDFENDAIPNYVTPKTGHIGIYENELGSLENAILVTSAGIELLGANNCKIMFEDITKIELPTADKLHVSHLNVHTLHSNVPVTLPVLGQKDRTRDVFEFLRFLKRCMADQQTI
jgi:hypothetical protein